MKNLPIVEKGFIIRLEPAADAETRMVDALAYLIRLGQLHPRRSSQNERPRNQRSRRPEAG
jgi:hypothetical protein